ncbi:MAG: type II toxin-antitoxin system HicB family antitoxin [Caldilineaceae bacterium]
MQYTVMIHRQPLGHYVAQAPAVPNCRGEGRTRNEALRQLKSAIEQWMLETEITTLEIQTPAPAGSTAQSNPWLATAGLFANDPMLEPMLQKILAAREAERPGAE